MQQRGGLVVLGLGWALWRRLRPAAAKPLHGETEFASEGELRRNGFRFERRGRYED